LYNPETVKTLVT